VANDNQKAEWTLGIKDELSDVAKSAASALDGLRDGIDADTKALAGMQKAMRNLQLGTSVNVAQFRKLKQSIDEKKASIAKAQSSYLNLGGTFTKTGTSGRGLIEKLTALTKTTQAVPKPVDSLSTSFSKLKKVIAGSVIAGAFLAIAAALLAIVAATASAIGMLVKYGIAQADARRSELLRLEGLTKLRFWYQRIPGNAKEMQTSIDRVSASVASSRDEVEGYNDHLYRLGLRGQNLSTALEAYAIAQSAGGKQAAEWFAGMAATVQIAGGSVKKLADDIKGRFGEIAARRMMSLDVQAKKLKESMSALFADLKIEKLLAAFKSITDLLGQSTASGRALKQILTVVLQPLIGQITDGTPLVKRFFQGAIIATQDLIIVTLKARLWFKRTFGDLDTYKGLEKMKSAAELGKTAVFGLLAVLGGVAAIGAGIGVVVYAFVSPFIKLYQIARVFWDFMTSLSWDDIKFASGFTLIEGIITGLRDGAGKLFAVVNDLANNVVDAFAKALKISSPSKVFAELGIQIPRGIAIGVGEGTPGARAAVADVIPPSLDSPSIRPPIPSMPPPPPSTVTPRVASTPIAAIPAAPRSAPSGGAGGGNTFNFGDIVIHSDSDKPDELAVDIRREIERVFEGIALQLGAPVSGAT